MSRSQQTAETMPPSRRKQIPGTDVLSWQIPETQAKKPRIRRPMTACEACRSAKAKCNGQPSCERCTDRGLHCIYTHHRNGNGDQLAYAGAKVTAMTSSNNQPTPSITTASPSSSHIAPGPMPVDLTGDIFSATGSGGTTADSAPTNDQMDPWCEKTFHQALEEFDWVFPEPAMGLDRLVDPNHNDLDFLSHPTGVPTPSGSSNDSANSAPLSNSGNTQHPTSHSAPNCPCRANIMLHVPKIESAIQEKPKPRLDDMFKVTGDVIRSCLESTRCGCRLGPVDLVCIMTVFEQTAVCFDYIAKSGFDGTVKVGIGNYCVSLKDDASLKRTLVLDLVSQANVFLDSLSALAQKMIALQNEPGVKCMGRSPACLTQLNFNYLREATASFKRLFRLMTEFFEGEHSDTRIQAGDYRSSVANS